MTREDTKIFSFKDRVVVIAFLLFGIIVIGFNLNNNEEIVFSISSGFYNDSLDLELSSPFGTEIYYTLDGTTPSRDSQRYDGVPIQIRDVTRDNVYSIIEGTSWGNMYEYVYSVTNAPDFFHYTLPEFPVDKCIVVSAVYYDRNGKRSNVYRQSYFFNYDDKNAYDGLYVVSISFDPEDMFGYENGIYVIGKRGWESEQGEGDWRGWDGNFNGRGEGFERNAHIEIYDGEHILLYDSDAGIRVQGGESRTYAKKSLNLYARAEGEGDNSFPDIFGTGYCASALNLFSGSQDMGTMLRDKLGNELTEECHFATRHYVPCAVFLNGEYWGLYYLTEKFDQNYFAYYYGVNADDVVIIKHGEVEKGRPSDRADYKQMVDYTLTAYAKDQDNYNEAKDATDMRDYAEYMAAMIYLCRQNDWHWPKQNFEAWRTSKIIDDIENYDGRWRWVMFDLNSSTMDYVLREDNTISRIRGENAAFNNLCNGEDFSELFVNTMVNMSNTCFNDDKVRDMIGGDANVISGQMALNNMRYFGQEENPYTEKFVDEIEQLKAFFENRRSVMFDDLVRNFGITDHIETITIESSDSDGGTILANGYNVYFNDESKWNGYYFSEMEIELEVVPMEGYSFMGFEGIEGGVLPTGETDSYRIAIDLKDGSVSLRAVFEKTEEAE